MSAALALSDLARTQARLVRAEELVTQLREAHPELASELEPLVIVQELAMTAARSAAHELGSCQD